MMIRLRGFAIAFGCGAILSCFLFLSDRLPIVPCVLLAIGVFSGLYELLTGVAIIDSGKTTETHNVMVVENAEGKHFYVLTEAHSDGFEKGLDKLRNSLTSLRQQLKAEDPANGEDNFRNHVILMFPHNTNYTPTPELHRLLFMEFKMNPETVFCIPGPT